MPKTILVTGGSRGIGRAVALRAGALGWSVAVGYREERTAAEAVVTAVEEIGGGGVVALEGDVAAEADVVATFGGARAALGPLDGVVVNAGIVGPPSPLADMPVERVRRTIDVNVLGTLLCAREAARCLAVSRGGRGGSIVLVSSAAARLGSPNEYVDYAASKGAVDTLCIGLSRELAADGVRVNAVRPGVIDTEIHASGGQPDRARRLAPQIPLGRPGTAEEVAEAIVWLLGAAASYTTGELLDVAGGR
jgi:NAD(P)-dependent dehydrogenase (short-subunit alcohol dehydrogenase family)